MPKPKQPRPTDAELQILRVLWQRGASTVREVYETISKTKPTGYTTVLKFMQIMAEKGLVRRDERERAHVYTAAQPRESTQRQMAGDLLERAFSGSTKDLLVGALSARKASRAELAELQQLLAEYSGGDK